MPKRTLGTLGALVKNKRGSRKLREVAEEIGIGPATLMRIEAGRIPDLTTFGKICKWLDVDPGSFLGFEARNTLTVTSNPQPAMESLSAHLKVDQNPQPETIKALAKMILFAIKAQGTLSETTENGDVR